MKKSKKPKRPSALWAIVKPVNKSVIIAITLSALSSVMTLTVLCLFMVIIHAVLQNLAMPWLWLLLLGVVTAAAFVLRLLAFHQSHLGAFRLEVLLREQIAEHLGKLPLGYIQERGAGALTKIMHLDVKNLHGFVADTTPLYGRLIAMPLLSFMLVFLIDWRLALVALFVLAVGMVVMSVATKDYQAKQDRYMLESEKINAAMVEFVQAMPVVRTFDSGTASYSRLQVALDNFKQFLSEWMSAVGKSAAWSMIIFSPLPTLLLVSIFGAYWVQSGISTIPSWVGILLLGSGLAESIMPMMWMNLFIKKSETCAERIQTLLNEPLLPETTQGQCPEDGSICFKDVSFSYSADAPPVLKNVSFEVPENSVTALVGASGAGKTTVAKLLPRFWDVTAGSVCIGGVDIRDMTQTTLMEQVAFVFQDTFLFHRSIAENIALANPDASQEDIEAAAKAAHAHEFIAALPDGYDSVAGERGAKLSGGQCQRITLARAILQDCPIIVLDEATAFADPESEAEIVKALGNLTRDKTILMVAHRLSTIQHAHQIVVFDHGELVESGTHASLLDQDGRYAELWQQYEQAQNWNLSLQAQESAHVS